MNYAISRQGGVIWIESGKIAKILFKRDKFYKRMIPLDIRIEQFDKIVKMIEGAQAALINTFLIIVFLLLLNIGWWSSFLLHHLYFSILKLTKANYLKFVFTDIIFMFFSDISIYMEEILDIGIILSPSFRQ